MSEKIVKADALREQDMRENYLTGLECRGCKCCGMHRDGPNLIRYLLVQLDQARSAGYDVVVRLTNLRLQHEAVLEEMETLKHA